MWRKVADVVFWIGVSLYFGGLMALGAVAAPAVFESTRKNAMTMPGILVPPLEMDRQVGGEIFGEILNKFGNFETVALGLMLLGISGWMFGPAVVRRSTWVVAALWVMLSGIAVLDSMWLRPSVWNTRETVRQEAAAHVADAKDAPWPNREKFDNLHHWSETLGRIKGYTLLGMIFVTAWRGLAEGKRNV